MKHVALVASLCLLAWSSSARADDTAKTEARVHIDKASRFHKDGKFQQALDELTVAYSLDPQPQLLYGIAQVHAKLGHCTLAIAFYKRFLGTHPDDGPAGAAQEAIAACKQSGDTGVTTPTPDPTTPTPTPTPTPAPIVHDEPVDPTWYRDAIGDALCGGGLVFALASVLTYSNALGKLDDADKAKSYQMQLDLVDSAHSGRVFAIGLGVTGAAMIGVGIYHYIWRADAATSPQIGVTPTSGGALASFAARF